MDGDRKGMEWWDRFCALETLSMWNLDGRGQMVPDACGNWLRHHEVLQVADAAQAEINRLTAEVEALRNRLKIRRVP